MELDPELVVFIFHHLFFPPKLPQSQDKNLRELESNLVRVVREHLREFINNLSFKDRISWNPALGMLDTWMKFDTGTSIDGSLLSEALFRLSSIGAIACHIRAQNCGLVATYDHNRHEVIFEAFEVSAQGDQVLAASNGLMRCFPGVGVTVSATKLAERPFRSFLATTISQLASEEVSQMLPKSKKAGTAVDEIRDTAHPGLITEGLMVQLLALGKPTSGDALPITKSVRDEVNWRNALLPWRRSPTWLVLRVALQLVLRRSFPTGEDRIQYKNFLLYLMASLAWKTPAYMDTHVEGLSIIRTKLGRRMYKIQDTVFAFVSSAVHKATDLILTHLRDLQEKIKDEDRHMITQVVPSASSEDCHLSLLNSKKAIYDVMHYSVEPQLDFAFSRRTTPPFIINEHGFPTLQQDSLPALNSFENHFNEVLHSLPYKTPVSHMTEVCHQVEAAVEEYFRLAAPKYALDVRATSLMLLTILELWVVLDKMSVQICPLLKEYSPEIPANFLEPLLLPKWSQMQRAEAVSEYIRGRRNAANVTMPSIFSDPSARGFAVRYYDRSKEHKELRGQIQRRAHDCREAKKRELAELNRRWCELRDEEAKEEHLYEDDNTAQSIHQLKCHKCSLGRKMKSMTIQVHEWPLPHEEHICRTVIFELKLPQWFASWRDVTWKIIHDICDRNTLKAEDLKVQLLQYPGTVQFQVNYGQRLTLGSVNKSWAVSHYSGVRLPVANVCYPNALRFRLFDSSKQGWVEDNNYASSVKKQCIFQLLGGPYLHLQYALDSCAHTQNEVLADQSNCDKRMCLQEFVAYGCLRSGEQGQWYNMLRELASSALSFNELAVVQLFKQAAWEFGSFCHETKQRVSHRAFQDPKFCERLVEVLRNRLGMIEGNWNEHQALNLFVTLAVRSMSLIGGCISNQESQSSLREDFASLLRQCRKVALGWCEQLSLSLHGDDAEQSRRHQDLIQRIATTCLETYDIDPDWIDALFHSPRDLYCLVRSSLLLFENCPEIHELPRGDFRSALQNAQRIRYMLKDRALSMACEDPTGLNDAVQKIVWYLHSSNIWTACDRSDGWISTRTEGTSQLRQQQVHYDLLTGEILVDGTPPGRLSKKFTDTPVYQRLFGCRTLPVMPSSLPGMSFVSAQKFGEFEVHFGMLEGDRAFVRARSSNQVLQYLPPELLVGDFPDQLVTDIFHWVDMETGVIEFRGKPWETNPQNWHVRPDQTGTLIAQKGEKTLIDVHGPIFAKVSDILQPLDTKEHILVLQTPKGVVEAELTRLRLKFFVNEQGSLESADLEAAVDTSQDIGCLYGLANKLVLRGNRFPHLRSVIIPYGQPVIKKKGCHVQVSLARNWAKRIKYLQYTLDEHLQLLQGPPDLLASLYQAYLHAVTTFPLPDPSIHRTGTQEALRILSQQRSQTPFPLTTECIETLQRIAGLTPTREFYPQHLKVMQTTHWHESLSPSAQHNAFRIACQKIFDFSQMFVDFHDHDPNVIPSKDIFVKRDRNSLVHRAGRMHGQLPGSDAANTTWYASRDCGIDSDRSKRVYEVAALIRDWPSALVHESNLVTVLRNMRSVTTTSFELPGMSYSSTLGLKLGEVWVSLYNFCRSVNPQKHAYLLMGIVSTIAFGGEIEQSFIRHFLLIAFSGSCSELPLPLLHSRNLQPYRGQECVKDELKQAIESAYDKWVPPTHKPGVSKNERTRKNRGSRDQWAAQKEKDIRYCSQEVARQWPCMTPKVPSQVSRIRTNEASQNCQARFSIWLQNKRFLDFVREVQDKLAPLQPDVEMTEQPPMIRPPLTLLGGNLAHDKFQPTGLFELVCKSSPIGAGPFGQRPEPPHIIPQGDLGDVQVTAELQELARMFRESSVSHHRDYGIWLQRSIKALEIRAMSVSETDQTSNGPSNNISAVWDKSLDYQSSLLERQYLIWETILSSLRVAGNTVSDCYDAIRPSMTVYSVLSLLRKEVWDRIPQPWKTLLIEFGRVVSDIRRWERLLSYIASGANETFMKEAENVSCDGWDPSLYPSWLLLEIEGNITIRKRQVEVAMEMINPREAQNAVVQLNMGEGKTSVITPMAAAVLGNGKNLVRILVLKPLLRQSFNVLSQRLGGLVDRRIYHVPFSRKTKLDSQILSNLKKIYEHCIGSCGIFICLPEQMLSLRLVCQDSGGQSWFKQLIKLETMLSQNCRDLIDESDEVLDTKFQLVYTVGTQQPLDGHSDRWEIAQHLLHLVAEQARRMLQEELNAKHTACIEVSSHGRRYPIIRFLKPGAFERLALYLLYAITHNGLPGLPFKQWTSALRDAVLNFIGDLQTSDNDQNLVRDTFEGSNFLPKLLILRGFFAHGVLEFALTRKRWLVDYGLHPSRCLMAVPYRAKGIPSDNAEFGHPDVAVVLTCLSYYYEGLKQHQLRECFANLGKGNDPSTEYATWAAESRLPRSLQSFSGVNLDDQKVFEEHLYPCLRYQEKVINFYMSHSVFPREGKEFPRKLSTSAWDIPSQVDSNKTTPGLTTGFSGTNDNRFLLPHSIRQQDLPDLLHTNAMVLGHLLEPRNRVCILAEDENGHQLDFHQLLNLICEKCDARVLIDVGAQILEYSNKEVASKWLSMTHENDSEAAVFFSDSDDIMVIDREGHVETLLSSSFRQRIGACLVFLDQHHSRGVDLRLPPQTRAAVTLGPRLTKDRLVQACNRLRGLGKSQSVVFLIPPEVKHDMMAVFEDPSKSQFASPDVLRWAMHQTCQSLDMLRPLWASHGLQHRRRTKIWKSITSIENPTEKLVADMQEPEARTLCELYAPWANQASILEVHDLNDRDLMDPRIKELVHTLIRSNSEAKGCGNLHEEQEREIAVEVEREVQVFRPTRYSPSKHKLDSMVRHFAIYGRFVNGHEPSPFRPAYSMLKKTSVGKTSYPSALLGAELYVTLDFINTVRISHGHMLDEFLKPVNWVLSSVHNNNLVIISQYEANALIPVVLNSKHASLHIYAPRSTKAMRSFRNLDFLTIGAIARQPSPGVTRELELFAGSLYFSSFEEYREFQSFLGLAADRLEDIPEGCILTDGFVDMKTRQKLGWPVPSPFWQSPLAFLAALMHVRTRGQGYRHTHVGTIIDVKPLTEDRF